MSSVGGGIGTITKQHMAKNDYGIFVLSFFDHPADVKEMKLELKQTRAILTDNKNTVNT